ncbi:MAG: hypothetical protein M3Q26_06875, partial [Acidobacteriota bacterium]|nr:hypothetical protein [Acidobacteriota bacterium]
NILIFVILNLISLVVSRNEHILTWNRGIRLGIYGGYTWGFPFEMFRGVELFRADGVVINTFIIVGCGFILGFFFRFIWSRLASHRSL